jgi:DNA-binding NarL/FixJ family response regulator
MDGLRTEYQRDSHSGRSIENAVAALSKLRIQRLSGVDAGIASRAYLSHNRPAGNNCGPGRKGAGKPMITVVVVDDHPIVRAGMRAVLDTADDMTVVAEGTSGAEALALIAQHRPDVLVLDVNLPDLNGVEVTRQLREQHTSTAILALTVHDDSQTIFGLLESGAVGYVLKDEALETLANAVRAAAQGDSWLSPTVARQVVHRAVGQASASPSPSLESFALTPSERRVLILLAQGLDNTAIAKQLVVTKRTVQNHVSHIYGKLGVNSRTEAMLYALRYGLTAVEPPEEQSHDN